LVIAKWNRGCMAYIVHPGQLMQAVRNIVGKVSASASLIPIS
jgi:hypothetical protein